jgi:hypothetical protein
MWNVSAYRPRMTGMFHVERFTLQTEEVFHVEHS